MERERNDESGETSTPKRDVSKTETDAPDASGPHAPSAPRDDRQDGKTQDNRKGGYGAG